MIVIGQEGDSWRRFPVGFNNTETVAADRPIAGSTAWKADDSALACLLSLLRYIQVSGSPSTPCIQMELHGCMDGWMDGSSQRFHS